MRYLDGEPPYYDRAGKRITMAEWIVSYADHEKRRVGLDVIDGVTISTVLLGLDHGWGDEPPMIFETMVFGGPLAEECERYSTEAEAIAGHAAMVARVRAAKGAT